MLSRPQPQPHPASRSTLAALAAAVWLAASLASDHALAQGLDRDAGHCEKNGQIVIGCWNTAAGDQLSEVVSSYLEIQPNLDGWDFRITLPHIHLQWAHADLGSDPVLVGVLEDFTSLHSASPPFGPADYAHRNNSVWLFRTRSLDGQVYFKLLPSRRNGAQAENATSLLTGWQRAGGVAGPRFKIEKPTVVTLREAVGTTIFVFARAENNTVYMSKLAFFTGGAPSWFEGWTSLGFTSTGPLAATAAFGSQVALASSKGWPLFGYEVRLFTPAASSWTPPTALAGFSSSAQLVWDGTALNGFFVNASQVFHVFSTSNAPLVFRETVQVTSGFPLANGQYHAELFNGRIHLTYMLAGSDPTFNPVYYTTAFTRFGLRSSWANPSYTGFNGRSGPRIATFYDQLFVIANGQDGRPRYARKDPNKRGNELTGGANDTRWLEAGSLADDQPSFTFGDPAVLSFNGDIYLTAGRLPQGSTAGYPYLMNFSRAALKRLATNKWAMRLVHGEPDGDGLNTQTMTFHSGATKVVGDFDGDGKSDLAQVVQRPSSLGSSPVFVARGDVSPSLGFEGNELWLGHFATFGEVPLAADVDGDGMDDLVSFAQRAQSDANGNFIGPAPVWVALSNGDAFEPPQVWHTFFSLAGEIPAVGDFNGDTKADIATFTQAQQFDAAGNLIGHAPVWVALSTGGSFGGASVWHPFFSLAGELPQVGDFNGDERADLVTFTQQPQHYADGTLLGLAPVWVSLSNGSSFQTSTVWATDFARAGEVPVVGDLDFDGRDDVMSFLHGQGGSLNENRSYAASSAGNRFLAPALMSQDFAKNSQVKVDAAKIVRSPVVAHVQGRRLSSFTGNGAHSRRFMPEILAFDTNNTILFTIPSRYFPGPWGAPWERYKMSPEKWLGLAMFPEWVWDHPSTTLPPRHCVAPNHRFGMIGRAGLGGAGLTLSSVHVENREGHVIEEFGHSLFALCLNPGSDPWGLFGQIFTLPPASGGIGAASMPGCVNGTSVQDVFGRGFYDCRDPEHYFISTLIRYRLMGDTFRAQTDTLFVPPSVAATARAQYLWIKNNWYQGVEFKRATSAAPASLIAEGVQCLPGECPLPSGGVIGFF